MRSDPVLRRSAVAAGAVIPIATAFALTALRDVMPQEQIVLLLATAVVLGAVAGGRAAGAAAAITAAVSFDFFFTKPYLSLRISSETDLATTAILLVVGLVVGQVALLARRRQVEAAIGKAELGTLFRVSRLAAEGDTPDDVELAVRSELLEVLALADCRFEGVDALDRPLLGPSGSLLGGHRHFAEGGFTLPDEGIAIAVDGAGRRFGYLLCTPVPAVGISIERRRVGMALADQLGLALAAAGRPGVALVSTP